MSLRIVFLIVLPPLVAIFFSPARAEELDDARARLDRGEYAEATTRARAASATHPIPAALLLSRIGMETGDYTAARRAIDVALSVAPDEADLVARRGELHLLRGDWKAAEADARAAIDSNEEHLAGHWVLCQALTETGRIKEATDAARWFVRYYNAHQPTDAESLLYLARGSLRYARWKRVSSVFQFVVGELCPDINTAARDDWRADALSGGLLLEKYNAAQGVPDLEAALAKNPNAADVLAALAAAALDDHETQTATERADAALKVNPSHLPAMAVKADLAVAENDLRFAEIWAKRALSVNPHDQASVGRLCAVRYLESDGKLPLDDFLTAIADPASDPASLLRGSADDARRLLVPACGVWSLNPKPGRFLLTMGEVLERRRCYPAAERCYRTAIAVMPELSESQVALALLVFRGGDLDVAGPLVEAGFKADPFHVRLSNMRKVIDLLRTYETRETAHFVIRFDPKRDAVLADLMADFMEEAYGPITTEFGFEPPGKTVVELFRDSQGQAGQEWFGTRLVGLPWVQTIGASTGNMIAMAAPTADMNYNWARVVRHEFVHVVTLQQTRFRIPHWYTEALAVRSEGPPRPTEWDALLRERVPADNLGTLDELNLGFTNPKTQDDRQFAYCQSLLYAEFLDRKFGPSVHRKLLAGYEAGEPTARLIQTVCGQPAREFDADYRVYLRKLVSELPEPSEQRPGAEGQTAFDPAGPLASKRLAQEAVKQADWAAAKRWTLLSLEAGPNDPRSALTAGLRLRRPG